jgi:hypothetical protein
MNTLREKAPTPKPPPEIRADERRYADWQEGCGAGIRFMSQLDEAFAEDGDAKPEGA